GAAVRYTSVCRGGIGSRWLRFLAEALTGALVCPEPEEGGMADAAALGPLAESHLAHEPGLDPVMALPRRRGARLEGRGGATQRPELLPEALQTLLVEAGADLRTVDQLRAVGHADLGR